MRNFELALERIFEAIIGKIPSLILAMAILVIGIWFIRLIVRIVRSRFERRQVDLSLRDFVISIIKAILYTMLIISVASMVGIQTTSFVAVLGAASLSIGLALQGSLSNFAGGVLILLFRPFRVGDYINSAGGAAGTVEKIDILYTSLRTSDGIAVFAPNGPLANSVISNYSDITIRRAEYRIGVSYTTDIRQVRGVVLDVLTADKRVLKKPAPEVHVEQLTDSTVVLLIRSWVARKDYWDAFYGNYEAIKVGLDNAGIKIPQQPELRVIQVDIKDNSSN